MSLIVDYFAGGGGVSEGIKAACGVAPDVAINHCEHSIAVHKANHPTTLHLKENVWNVHPVRHLPGGPVWLAWFSPSCQHFSRARGGKPVSKQLRALPWVATRFAAARRPDVIIIENVAEFRKWGPIAADGQPDPARAGDTYRAFRRRFEKLGYVTEDRVLDAADFGAPTHRKRLFLIARCDGQPIGWPEPTHGPGRQHPYRTAAECIDWSIPCPSIFGRKRPLAEATMRRIAEGLKRYLFEAQHPFLIQVNHGRDTNRSQSAEQPMPTITAKHGFGVVMPTLIPRGFGERPGQTPRTRDVNRPLGTIVAEGEKFAVLNAFLTKYYGTSRAGAPVDEPAPVVTAQGNHVGVVAPFLTKYYGPSDHEAKKGTGRAGQPVSEPIHTIPTANRFGLVAAFLTKYYGASSGQNQSLSEPLHTILTKARFGLVTVELNGETYALADIGLRMLTPRELARCQGFPDTYQLFGTQEQQVARVGNSVPPQLAEAVVRANRPVPRTRSAA